MSTAFGIITGHGGKVEVDNMIGKGSTFTIQLPITMKVADHIDAHEQVDAHEQEQD